MQEYEVSRPKCSVSVVIPTYNSSKTLRRALDSIVAQTLNPLRIIVVDDRSEQEEREKTQVIVAEYGSTELICLPVNRGAASARNAGWSVSDTEWVAFLDSDDAWHPRKLELQIAAAESWPRCPALVASDTLVVEDVRTYYSQRIDDQPDISEILASDLLIRSRWSTSSVIIWRDIPYRFREGRRYSEDYELWLNVSAHPGPMIRVEVPLTAQFKERYGVAGLSAHLGKMASGELLAYVGARREGSISTAQAAYAMAFSGLRSARRIVLVAVRSLRESLGSRP